MPARTTIQLDITPMGAVRMTQRSKWQPRAMQYLRWKGELKLLAQAQGFEISASPHIVFSIPMPESWSKKKKAAMDKKPCQSKPDIDNLIKAVFDALIDDDKSIHTIQACKLWGTTGSIVIW